MSANSKNVLPRKSAITPLMFGIPQLDELLGYQRIFRSTSDSVSIEPSGTNLYVKASGVEIKSPTGQASSEKREAESGRFYDTLYASTSLTIVGEDGTGKSLFALHIAAAYAALHYRATRADGISIDLKPPRIIYASSDYRLAAAQRVWAQFFLDYPWHRYIPGIDEVEREFRTEELKALLRKNDGAAARGLNVRLNECPLNSIATKLLNLEPLTPNVRTAEDSRPWRTYDVDFIDLSSETSGDDWRFLTSLVAAFPRDSAKSAPEPPSVLIVDSVAGFETFIGKTNTFGEESTRRSRISQLLRAAGDSWHVVFIAEEPDQIKHHPEEYVTDTVFHLHRTGSQEKVHRYLEIEKCRASNYAQGEHQFEIRDGKGTSTRSWENPDDLRVSLHPEFRSNAPEVMLDRDETNAYIQVFPSLHYLSKKFGSRHSLVDSDAYDKDRDLKPFGIKYLDDMLRPAGDSSKRGLRPATVTAVIGEEGTRKIFLAEQFLVAAYEDVPEILNLFITVAKDFRRKRNKPKDEWNTGKPS